MIPIAPTPPAAALLAIGVVAQRHPARPTLLPVAVAAAASRRGGRP